MSSQTRKRSIEKLWRPSVSYSKMNLFGCVRMEMEMWKIIYDWNSMHIASVSGPDLLSPHLQRPLYCPLVQLKLNSEKKNWHCCPKMLLDFKSIFMAADATEQIMPLSDDNRIDCDEFSWWKLVKKKKRLHRKLRRHLGCSASHCKLKPGFACQCAKGWCHKVAWGDRDREYKCWKAGQEHV